MGVNRATLALGLTAVAVSVALFVVKYRVQDLNDELYQLNRDILSSQEAIHVLKTEWSHLNQPERLRKLADTHLEMGPAAAEQVSSLEALPVKPEVEADGDASTETTGGAQ